MIETDILVIGGGPGGYETALSAAQAGLKTVVVEAERLGGTCLNEGCIPTKCLCRTAEVLDLCKNSEQFGIERSNIKFNITKAQERKDQVVDALRIGVSSLMKSHDIQVIYGKAEFKNAKTVVVREANDGAGNAVDNEIFAKNIIIATGSKTKFLPVPGVHLEKVITSKDLLSIDKVPKSLCIVGGGVIGIEFASIFSTFGSKVTVVEFCKEILPNFDSELSKRLRMTLKHNGVDFHLSSAVTGISQTAEGMLSVNYQSKNKENNVDADFVLMAVGRSANLDSLNLSDIGISTDKKGIVVDENYRTSVNGIYAVGDINGHCQLAHAAKYQGMRALNNILGKSDCFDFNVIPAAVFTTPEFSMVGKTENECESERLEYKVRKAFFRANGKAMAMNSTEGLVKLITGPDEKVIGCHIMGPHASDLIEEVAIVIQHGGTLCDISHVIHAHPTLSEVVCESAHD